MHWQRLTKALPLAGLALLGMAGAADLSSSLPVTSGAAPGYVPDRACADCHSQIAASYQEIGMARSLASPSSARALETFGPSGTATFEHLPSHQSFAMERRGDRLFFRRWQVAADGKPINSFEQEVSWVLGSGNHARVYLYRTGDGELFQLPVAWYSQEGRWGMAPGYDRAEQEGVLRRVRRECLFCHDAYPETAAGSDGYGAPQVFPERLPEGIGCQRCHGPGGEHVRRASGGMAPREEVRAAIVNPARLPGTSGDEVCNQCHLQPEVALPMVRRFGRGDDSYRPGEPLAEYVVHTDLGGEEGAVGGRFEINHHAYQLRQSRCFAASAGKLHCWTCHDPHRRLPKEELAARVRATCESCHPAGSGSACKRQRPAETAPVHSPGTFPGASPAGPVHSAGTFPGGTSPVRQSPGTSPTAPVRSAGTSPAGTSPVHSPGISLGASDPVDCAGCHMPKRRPQDVVHVVMTDHRIQRQPQGADLTAPRAEADPVLSTVRLYEPGKAPPGDLGAIYLALSVVRAGAFPSAVDRLETLLASSALTDPEPYLELAAAEIKRQRPAVAEELLRKVLARSPAHPLALSWLGVARAAEGRPKEAEDLFRRALALPGADRAEVRFNLALLLAGDGRAAAAVPLFEATLAERSNLVAGWVHLGRAVERLGRLDRAVECYRRALAIDPTQTDAYLGLGKVLVRRGERAEAIRVLTQGATAARRPAAVAAALQETLREISPGKGG